MPALATPTYGDGVRLLPMTDDRVETHVAIADPESPSGRRVVHFQEYWVRLRAAGARPRPWSSSGSRSPRPAPASSTRSPTPTWSCCRRPTRSSRSARSSASRGSARRSPPRRRPVVGLSPIVGGTHVRGMAEQMLTSIGVEVSAAGVGLHYGARSARRRARRLAGRRARRRRRSTRIEAAGLACRAVPLMMTDPDATAAMAAAAVELVAR